MSVIADLIRAGVDPEMIVRVHEEIVAAASAANSMSTRTARQERNSRYYARLGVSTHEWGRLRALTFERDGFKCVYCGTEKRLECDHVIPRARGGRSVEDNLATACRSCNASKKDFLLGEWRPNGH